MSKRDELVAAKVEANRAYDEAYRACNEACNEARRAWTEAHRALEEHDKEAGQLEDECQNCYGQCTGGDDYTCPCKENKQDEADDE